MHSSINSFPSLPATCQPSTRFKLDISYVSFSFPSNSKKPTFLNPSSFTIFKFEKNLKSFEIGSDFDLMANGDEEEAMLELSIGGIFGKQKKLKQNASDRIGDLNVNMNQSNELNELMDLKGEIGVRRRELRRKREEKMGSCGSVTGPFVENKEWLDTQVVRRNAKPVYKKEKIGLVDDDDDDVNCGFKAYNGKLKLKGGGEDEVDGGGGRCCCKMNLKGCGSFPCSDGQCSSHQVGVVTDDSRSNSSNSQLDQQPASTSTTTIEPPVDPSKQATKISTTESANPEPSCQQQASLLDRMPCVSTTGNGPNGKTISGFLYRYTKNEVSIVCVCHGRSFSPAGFVEHAGGVDIAHPLKHITIVPAAFAS